MFKNLKSYFDVGNDFYGLEIYSRDNVTFYHLIQLQKTKKELILVNETLVPNWEQLLELINSKIPVYLTINSVDVLDKIVVKNSNGNHENLIHQAFPSLDFERFYFNSSEFGNFNYLAIAEKINIDNLLKQFDKAGIPIAAYFLGLTALSFSISFLSYEEIHTNTKRLLFGSYEENGKAELNSENITEQSYLINGLDVKSSSLISFSSVLSNLLKTNIVHTNYEETSLRLATNFKYERWFRVLLWPTIIFFLTLLLANFFTFNFYFDRLAQTNQDENANTISKNRLTKLKKIVDAKERKVESILANQNSSATFFIDEIAKNIPSSILLIELNYQPLLKPVRNLKAIELDNGIITISGETSDSEAFSLWIETIEDFEWVTKVETTDYNFGTNSSSNFSLKVTTNEQ